MLADCAGMLYVSAVVSADVSPEHRFRDSKAKEGLLLGREALSKAFGVPLEHIDYLPRGMTMNIDDMACIYSTQTGFQIVKEKGTGPEGRRQRTDQQKLQCPSSPDRI